VGRNNKQRRAMKEKARRRATAGGSPGGASFTRADGASATLRALDVADGIARARIRAFAALDAKHRPGLAAAAAELAALTIDTADRRIAERVLLEDLRSIIGALWRNGWQPADVARMGARRLSAAPALLLREAVADELRRYPRDTVDPSWWVQCETAEIPVGRSSGPTLLGARTAAGMAWRDQVVLVLEVLYLLHTLPPLEVLTPLPGTARARQAAGAASAATAAAEVDERVLARVRALLAKAESTTFDAEAETFTAGAQALMARHSIDRAMLDAGRPDSEGPVARRLGLDPPYEDAKATLFQAVAEANRCRTAWSKNLGFVTVIGFPGDVRAVETLVTSLLVQAAQMVKQAGTRTTAYGSRTRSFRKSFLMSFATRIGERLTEAARDEGARAAGEAGYEDLLPVLARRDARVDEAVTALFPALTTTSISPGYDREGWTRGRAAADLAALSPGAPVTAGNSRVGAPEQPRD
jgi:hypothetical protein